MRFAPIILAAALLSAQTPAQKKSKFEITEVRATGCVRALPQSNCLLLQTLDGSTTYSFTAAPKPDLDTVITIHGKAHEGKSPCKVGIVIDVVDWEPTDQMCVPSAPQKAK